MEFYSVLESQTVKTQPFSFSEQPSNQTTIFLVKTIRAQDKAKKRKCQPIFPLSEKNIYSKLRQRPFKRGQNLHPKKKKKEKKKKLQTLNKREKKKCLNLKKVKR